MGIPAEEWDYILSPVIMFYQTLSQELFQMELIIDKH